MSIIDLKTIQAYVINLDARTDRWASIQRETVFLNPKNITRLSAVNKKHLPASKINDFGSGAWGLNLKSEYVAATLACLMSHVECIKDAKRNKYPYVLILEDDAIFEKYSTRVMDKAFTQLKDLDWDILFLGGKVKIRQGGFTTTVSKNLVRVNKLRLAHAYIINQKVYDRVIGEAYSRKVPIDWYYSDLLQVEGRCYMVDPPVAFQKEEQMSDIADMVVHKKKLKNKFKRLLSHLRSYF